MPVVIGVRFKDSGKIYSFAPGHLTLAVGDEVIVETVRGLELARVATAQREVADEDVVGELKSVVRRAEQADLDRLQMFQSRHAEALARCAAKVREHDLPMDLVKAEYSFDGSRLTFFFTAEKRVDFRMLVRDLARTFRSRIELRQIGPRDEAKLLGGIGPCGRILCCTSFLPDYARVTIKMAKDQDLPLNPSKISGVCGRLLCCLSYEHEQYVEMRAELPRRGTWVMTPDGPGEVIGQNVLKQSVLVQLASSEMVETYSLEQVTATSAQVAATARARTAEGITPAAQARPPRPDRGERRKLRDEIDQYEQAENLDLLEDEPSVDEAPRRPPREPRVQSAERPQPPRPRTPPPAPRAPEATATDAPRRRDEAPRPRRAPTAAESASRQRPREEQRPRDEQRPREEQRPRHEQRPRETAEPSRAAAPRQELPPRPPRPMPAAPAAVPAPPAADDGSTAGDGSEPRSGEALRRRRRRPRRPE